jgi:dTMP kinase
VATAGVFVTFEGVEGGGKSTQVRLLASRLAGQRVPLLVSREPGGSPLADRVREILVGPEAEGLDPKTELLLVMAARSHHVENVLRPALDEGRLVICDRFTDSTICYQGAGRGIDRDTIDLLNGYSTGGLTPDITFLIDVQVEDGLARLARPDRKLDRFEQQDVEYHRRVRDCYLELAASAPDRFVVVRGDRPVDEVGEDVYRALWTAFPTFRRER